MTNVFTVIGENREDPDRLLTIGSDGHHYAYHLVTGTNEPTEPDETWLIDVQTLVIEEILNAVETPRASA